MGAGRVEMARLFFWMHCMGMQDLPSSAKYGTSAPLRWKYRVLTTGPQGNSPAWGLKVASTRSAERLDVGSEGKRSQGEL